MPTVKATKGPGTKAYNRYAYYLAMANGVDTRVPNKGRGAVSGMRPPLRGRHAREEGCKNS